MRKVSGAEQFALETGQVSVGKVANEGNWEGSRYILVYKWLDTKEDLIEIELCETHLQLVQRGGEIMATPAVFPVYKYLISRYVWDFFLSI